MKYFKLFFKNKLRNSRYVGLLETVALTWTADSQGDTHGLRIQYAYFTNADLKSEYADGCGLKILASAHL